MYSLKQAEELVDSGQPDDRYVWFDADTLVYLAALKMETFDLPVECAEDMMTDMYERFKKRISEECWLDEPIIISCFSDSHTFRNRLTATYKANRKGKWKPNYIRTLRNAYSKQFVSVFEPNYEADDLVAILQTSYPGHVLASGDKDLDQIAGRHYNPRTYEAYTVTDDEAARFRIYQWLVGDTADGYKGCYLIGDKKAKAILDKADTLDRAFIEELLLLYEGQNEKAKEKDKPTQCPQMMHSLSQMLIKRLEEYADISDPFLLCKE